VGQGLVRAWSGLFQLPEQRAREEYRQRGLSGPALVDSIFPFLGDIGMQYSALSLLGHLATQDIDWILSHSTPTTTLAEGTLLREGHKTDSIFFVFEGRFRVVVGAGRGQPIVLRHVGPGSILGEMSWLEQTSASASVIAEESGAALALPVRVLERKLAEDLRFSAAFHRAIALESSQRLRTVPLVQHGGSVDEAAAAVGAASADLRKLIGEFKALLAAADKAGLEGKGTIPQEYWDRAPKLFRSLMTELNRLLGSNSDLSESARAALGHAAQVEMLPYLLLSATAERFYSKPRGYAGDYFSIQMMYENKPAGVGRIGPLIDRCFLAEPGPQAARNRRRLVANEILSTVETAAPARAHIASLACGPAREIFDTLDELAGRMAPSITCLDIDREALAMVTRQAESSGFGSVVRTEQANLIYLATGKAGLDLPAQDLIYSIGLIDYFNDQFVIKLIDWIHARLRTGGRCILGNCHPRNPDRAVMDYVLDWRLIYRDESDMNRLFMASSFARSCSRVLFESEGINLFAECVKA